MDIPETCTDILNRRVTHEVDEEGKEIYINNFLFIITQKDILKRHILRAAV